MTGQGSLPDALMAPSYVRERDDLHAAVAPALKEDARSVAGGGRQARLRRGLVGAQVAMSMLLLAGAGLFARSLYNLRGVNPGFDVDRSRARGWQRSTFVRHL